MHTKTTQQLETTTDCIFYYYFKLLI